MALSRMYLGRHFLADVIAGAGLGVIAFALTCLPAIHRRVSVYVAAAVSAGLLAACFLWQVAEAQSAGGVIAALTVLAVADSQTDVDVSGSLLQKFARVVIGFILYLAIESGVEALFDAVDLDDTLIADGISGFVAVSLTLVLTLWTIRRFGLLLSAR